MKLSDLHPDDVIDEKKPSLKLSDLHPDDVSDGHEMSADEPEVSKLESAARGYAQGLSSGIVDEATGKLEHYLTGKPYLQARQESRDAYHAAQKANPVTYGGSEFLGGASQVAATAAIPVVGPAARLGSAVAQGALSGYGYSEKDDLKGQVQDTATGGAIGGSFGVLGEMLAKIPGSIRNLANNRSAAALGAERGTINKFGPAKVQNAGKIGLQEGTISLTNGTPEMTINNEAVKDRGWQMMNDVFSRVDDTGKRYVDPLETAVKIDEKIGNFYRSPINRSETAQLENTIESVLMRGDKKISLVEAHELQKELGKVAKWGYKNPTDKELMAREAYFVVSDEIEKATETAMREIGDPKMLEQLKKGRDLYSAGKTSEEMLINRNAREQGNKMGFGLTDTIWAGGAWGATKNPEAVIAALVAKRLAERYGNQATALTANKLANGMEKIPQSLGRYAQPTMTGLVRGAQNSAISANSSGEENQSTAYNGIPMDRLAGTKYEAQMAQAMAKDPKTAAVTHYIMAQNDKEYDELVNGKRD